MTEMGQGSPSIREGLSDRLSRPLAEQQEHRRPWMTIVLALLVFAVLLSIPASCLAQSNGRYDKYGGVVAIKGLKTGWFHVEQINDRWLFVTPEGHGFFSLGVTHAVDCIRKDELDLFETKFNSSEKRLSDFILNHFKRWGYNSSGYGGLGSMENRVPYIASIWTEGPRSLSAGKKSEYSDIFDPVVQKRLKEKVRKLSARHVANRFCMGYVFIDLPIWSPTFRLQRGGESYADFFRSLDLDSQGKRAYVKFLTSRYQDNSAGFETTYGIAFAPLQDMLAKDLTRISVKSNESIAADDELFLNQAADTYYRCVVGELRRIDPHHLICGDRFMALPERTPDSILKTAAKYNDVISFQPMGTKKLLRDYIDHVTKITGKPVLLADVNTMTQRPEKDRVDTADYERSAGEHTMRYYLNAASSPGCIGIHRCTIRDYLPWNTKFHRRGLLKADDSPYSILIDYTKRTNKQVFDMVYSPEISKLQPAVGRRTNR